MKKRNLFVATALMLVSPLFYACSDDKDDPETTKPSQTVSVVGQWNAANATNMYDESFTINSNGTIYLSLIHISYPTRLLSLYNAVLN